MTFEEAYQKYLDDNDPDRPLGLMDVFRWFFNAGVNQSKENLD